MLITAKEAVDLTIEGTDVFKRFLAQLRTSINNHDFEMNFSPEKDTYEGDNDADFFENFVESYLKDRGYDVEWRENENCYKIYWSY